MAIRVGINGFGRIGRAFFRSSYGNDDIEIVAVNDLADPANLAYLLKHDSVYGTFAGRVTADNGQLVVDGKAIPVLAEKDPANLPWGDMNVDVVVESTGFFTEYAKSKAHIEAGAKRVVISAPVKDSPEEAGVTGATVLMGANNEKLGTCQVSSNASCTTNAASPLIGILSERIGIEKALLNTVHGYTASQAIVDRPDAKDFRRGRAAAVNIVPSSTGAAKATTLAYEDLAGMFDGIALRVPVPAGSIADVTFVAKRATTAEEVNEILRKGAADERWSGVFAVTEEPLVSSDILGEPYGAIADLSMTRVAGDTLVKVLAWYDNEAGYVHTLVQHVVETGKHI